MGTLGFDTPSGIQSTNFTTPESIELQQISKIMKDGGINYVPMEISSHAIEMNRIDHVNINIAIFTNLGHDHLDFHGNIENYFLSNNIILADKFFCIIESSIWVPTVLGSKATLTPVPKMPLEETPTQPDNINPNNKIIINLFFIF